MSNIIEPVQIPDASASEYAGGDVRHFSQNDELGHAAISAATRQLAHRDNEISRVVNQLVAFANNKEQFVTLPTVRAMIPPSVLETVTNFRIPPGFEARVLNAKVTSGSNSVRLTISWAAGFGATSGTSVVDTLDEAPAGTTFYGSGEFVIQLNNTGGSTAEAVASILLTVRPVGVTAGGLIGPGAVGPQGPAGPQGGSGSAGGQGPVGPAGTPGMVWKGGWASGTSYAKNDTVRYQTGGSAFAVYISLVPNLNSPPPVYPTVNNGVWELAALGPEGPASFNWRGSWSAIANPAYIYRDVVSYQSGSNVTSWVAGTAPSPGVSPSTGNGWVPLFDVRSSTFAKSQVPGFFVPIANFSAGSLGYKNFPSSGTYPVTFTETSTAGLGNPSGVAQLRATLRASFAGTADLRLPTQSDGAKLNWSPTDVSFSAVPHNQGGTLFVESINNSFRLRVEGQPCNIELNAVGLTSL
jgi:hypothetical protein